MHFPVHCNMLQDLTVGNEAKPAYGYPIPALNRVPQPAPPYHLAQIDVINKYIPI